MFAQIGRAFFFLKYFSGDAIFLVTLFVLFLIFALYFGRGRLISIILSFYPTTLLYNTFPFINKVIILSGDKMITLNRLVVFLVFLIPISITLERYIFSESEYNGSYNFFSLAGLSLATVVLVVLFSYTTLNFDLFHNFSPQIDSLFSGIDRIFYWNLVPLALLAIF